MKQQSFANAEYDLKKRKTRREKLLERMDKLIPWKQLELRIKPITQVEQLLYGKEDTVWGNAGYLGIDKREEHEGRDVDWRIALRLGKRK